MARAGRVVGVKPKKALRDNARLVIDKRLQELLSWRSALADPAEVSRLHDMRIAAKRLRYALEMFQVCFPQTKDALKDLTDIQERIGDIHDLDVLLDLMRKRLQTLDADVEQAGVEIMASGLTVEEKSKSIHRLLGRQSRDQARLGLVGLIAANIADRRAHYAELQARWGGEPLQRFANGLREAVGLIDLEPKGFG